MWNICCPVDKSVYIRALTSRWFPFHSFFGLFHHARRFKNLHVVALCRPIDRYLYSNSAIYFIWAMLLANSLYRFVYIPSNCWSCSFIRILEVFRNITQFFMHTLVRFSDYELVISSFIYIAVKSSSWLCALLYKHGSWVNKIWMLWTFIRYLIQHSIHFLVVLTYTVLY